MPGFELAASEHRLPASGVGRWPDGTRPDSTEFDWGLTVTTRQDSLIIEGSDRRTLEDDGSEVFHTSGEALGPGQAASLIPPVGNEVGTSKEA